jgi:hypothetical protein
MEREKHQVGDIPLHLRRSPLMALGGHDPHLDHAMHERARPWEVSLSVAVYSNQQ